MIDTHAHIDREEFTEDRKEMLDRAFTNGINTIIIPAIKPSDFKKVIDIAELDERIFCAVGIHPHDANTATEENLRLIENLAKHPKVVAIGETGLDYYYDYSPIDVQIASFEQHLQLSKRLDLPIIVHNRESDDDIIKLIEENQDGSLRGVMHCFSGEKNTLERALALDFFISFTGNITFKKSTLAPLVEEVPMDRLLLETDAPFMSPVPMRGKRNEPSFLKFTVEKIAEIKKISINEVINMTTMNAKRLFNLCASFVLIFLASFAANETVFAQAIGDSAIESEDFYKDPFKKYIGIGPTIGFNTIVETKYLKAGERADSYEGIVAYGGAIRYYPFNFLNLEAAYIYSKNEKVTKIAPDRLKPHIHQQIDLTTNWIANPNSRINFFGTLGATLFFNRINTFTTPTADPVLKDESILGINFGLGFIINIDFSFGVFTVSPEWRLGFPLAKSNTVYYTEVTDEEGKKSLIGEKIKTTTFFSIPRINIQFFPYFD